MAGAVDYTVRTSTLRRARLVHERIGGPHHSRSRTHSTYVHTDRRSRDCINLFLNSPQPPMPQIFVKTLTGKKSEYNVEEDDTVRCGRWRVRLDWLRCQPAAGPGWVFRARSCVRNCVSHPPCVAGDAIEDTTSREGGHHGSSCFGFGGEVLVSWRCLPGTAREAFPRTFYSLLNVACPFSMCPCRWTKSN